MTAPEPKDYGVPAGAMRPGDLGKLQNINGDSINWGQLTGITAAAEEARNGFLQGLRSMVMKPLLDIFSGKKPKGWEDISAAFQDGQLALKNRLDLLDGVRGYCQAYMSQNVNGEWGTNNTRMLPFDAPLGPSRGAHVDAAKGGIVMDEPGLWTISLLCTARWTAYTSSWLDTDSVRATLRVHRPDGSVYSQKVLQYLAGKSAVTPTLSVPVVVDQPGYYVTVEAYSSRWRWWDGGTRYSALAVVKHDSRLVNPGQETVPDESR